MLGVSVASDPSWNEHISSVAKSAARKIAFLFRPKRFFTPLHLLALYNAQIRPCLEYGSHLWRGASKYSLASLDTIQKRAIRLIDNSALTDSLDSLAHRRNVSALSLYYRYYHGRCSDELKSVIPPKACPGAQTPTPPPSHLINFPFSSVMQGSFEIHRGCILLERPFLHSISLKKKK